MSCFKNTIISSAIVLLFCCANNMTTEYVYANNLLLDSHKTLPNIPFITNKGQIDNEVKYYARIAGGTVFVTTGGELVYRFNKFTLKEHFNGETNLQISGGKLRNTKINCFRGNEPTKWKNNIPCFDIVNLGEVYRGINIKLKAHENNVEKLFFVHPGSSTEDIKIIIDGMSSMRVAESGELRIENGNNNITFSKPIAYQDYNDSVVFIDVEYAIYTDGYGFSVSDYDTTKTLCIDPLLASTYFGGSDADEEYEPRLILDEEGFVYITGNTSSDDFPTTTGAYSENFGGGLKDRFISKFDADLTTLISSTFIGGAGEETGMGITLDSVGNIYITGYSTSSDFPTTSGSYDETHNGGRDAYISKLNNDMTTLISSTYIGGNQDEGYRWPRSDLIIGENSEIYVVGLTKSTDFPVTSNAYDTTYNGGGDILNGGDIFISKFTADLSQLISSSYLGGSDDEWRVSFVLDDDENIIICGDTQSGDYPTTPGVYDRTFNGGFYDVFVSKFSSDLTTLSASTFLGSNGGDDALAIRLDNDGNVGLIGYTTSPSFPTTTGAYDRTYNGGERDAFIVKLDNELSNIQTSTFLGGSSSDTGEDFIIDGNGNFYIVGVTTSSDFPTSNDAYDISYNGGGDIFISKLDYNLSTLQSSTYIGGNNEEKGQCIDIDNSGNIYTISRTKSYNLPVTENSYNNTFNGGFNDCYIAKLDSSLSANPSSVGERRPLQHSLMLYNYPNPFNSSTTISYIIPTASYIRLNIYNILGSKIETIVNESQSKGLHNVIWDSKMFPSGIYFCKLNAGDYTETLRFSLIK